MKAGLLRFALIMVKEISEEKIDRNSMNNLFLKESLSHSIHLPSYLKIDTFNYNICR
jgi:hypothetical protein